MCVVPESLFPPSLSPSVGHTQFSAWLAEVGPALLVSQIGGPLKGVKKHDKDWDSWLFTTFPFLPLRLLLPCILVAKFNQNCVSLNVCLFGPLAGWVSRACNSTSAFSLSPTMGVEIKDKQEFLK